MTVMANQTDRQIDVLMHACKIYGRMITNKSSMNYQVLFCTNKRYLFYPMGCIYGHWFSSVVYYYYGYFNNNHLWKVEMWRPAGLKCIYRGPD